MESIRREGTDRVTRAELRQHTIEEFESLKQRYIPPPPKTELQDQCPLFSTIPPEIKRMIYYELLVSKKPISGVDKLLGTKRAILLADYHPIGDIDSTIMQTCRRIYQEALPILYGQNTFEFSSAMGIRRFKEDSLRQYPIGD